VSVLPVIVGVLDEDENRVDPKRLDGTRGPIMLKVGQGLVATAEVQGGMTIVTITDRSAVVTTTVKTAAYTAAAAELVSCDPSAGAFPVTLPPLADVPLGTQVAVWNATASTNAITVTADGSDQINGAATQLIESAYGRLVLVSAATPGGGRMWSA
jgi:hypothetical protein